MKKSNLILILMLFIVNINFAEAKSFLIKGKIKYSNTNLLYIDERGLKPELKSFLLNELKTCKNIKIVKNDKDAFWRVSIPKVFNKFYLKDKISKKRKVYQFKNYKNDIPKIHQVVSIVSTKFGCDNRWISKNLVFNVPSVNKQTKLYISDITGTDTKKLYNNKSLLVFPKIYKDNVYFTSIVKGSAYLLKFNLINKKVTKLKKSENGYLILSDIKEMKNGQVKLLYTNITNNGQIQIEEYLEGEVKSVRYSMIYKELQFSKILMSPKYSRKDKNIIYFIAESFDKTYDIYQFNISTRKILNYINGKKILNFDISDKDDLVYKDLYKGRYNYKYYSNVTHKQYILNTYSGKSTSKPIFVNDEKFFFYKTTKSGMKNLFIYDIKQQSTIKMNQKYLYFNQLNL